MRARFATLLSGRGYTEGPAVLGDGRIALTTMSEGRVLILDGSIVVAEVVTGGGPTGLTIGHDRAIYVAQNNGQWGSPSNSRAVLMKWADGQLEPVLDDPLIAPNDLCFGPDACVYITDPLTEAALERPVKGRIYKLDMSSRAITAISKDVLFPNGIAFDQKGQLFVAETFTGCILQIDLQTGCKSVIAKTIDGKPDGMAFDMEGNLWVAVNASDSVQVFAPSGELLDRLHLGDGSYPSNVCFAGTQLIVTTAGYGGASICDVGVEGLPLHNGYISPIEQEKDANV